MAELKYQPVAHDHDAFLNKAMRRKDARENCAPVSSGVGKNL